MKESIKHKLIKKEKNMSKRSGMIGFALAGLAAGIATWYLLGTKEGRANLDRAIEGINDLSTTVKAKAKEQMEHAADKVDVVKHKFSEMKNDLGEETRGAVDKARKAGKKMSRDAGDIAKLARKSADGLVNEVKDKAKEYRS